MSEKPIPIRGTQIDLEELLTPEPVFADELVAIYAGDCLEVLRQLPTASVDSIVTDPPAGIGFMGKTWDRPSMLGVSGGRAFSPHANRNPTCRDCGGRRRAGPATKGCHCDKPDWRTPDDRGDFIAFMAAVMAECLRILKPGGHAFVWAIPRTSHWTATAIEDVGFEIRDVVTHHFGSGFPKSLDVSKAIDKATVRDRESAELKFRGFMDDIYKVTAFIKDARDRAGKSNADIDALFGFVGMSGHWTSSKSQPAVPQWEQWLKLKELLPLGDTMDAEVWRLNGRKGEGWKALEDTAWAERAVTGQHDRAPAAQTWKANYGLDADLEAKERRDEPATEAAATWQGWGTALKPASEHWILARKPLGEPNVAANVLKHGTGALNIDGCRIEHDGSGIWGDHGQDVAKHEAIVGSDGKTMGVGWAGTGSRRNDLGRWPANLALSHSAACDASGCVPDCPVAELDRQSGVSDDGVAVRHRGVVAGIYGGAHPPGTPDLGYGGSGGASRFFYTAKAASSERSAGLETPGARNVHPTVKPVDLMRWLCRLITPPGGVVLDPFLGSGTTLVAAKLEGFKGIGIEREAEYVEIAKRRLGWAIHEPTLFDDAA